MLNHNAPMTDREALTTAIRLLDQLNWRRGGDPTVTRTLDTLRKMRDKM